MNVDPALTPKVQADVDRIHGFRVLAHAEIQAFVESLVLQLLDTSLDQWLMNGRLTHAGHHLIVYASISTSTNKATAAAARYPAYSISDALALAFSDLEKAVKQHRKQVERNSGIKESNVRFLLLPLGFRESFVRPGLFRQLDDLGKSRGDVAHGSGVIRMTQWPSGSTEWNRINQIMIGLGELDRFVPRLLMPVS